MPDITSKAGWDKCHKTKQNAVGSHERVREHLVRGEETLGKVSWMKYCLIMTG